MRVAHFLPHYPGRDGSAAFCRGLSRAMNRIAPGSCPILTMRPGEVEAGPDEELLHYPQTRSFRPFDLPAAMLTDLADNRHHLDGVVLHGTYNPPMAALGKHLRRLRFPYLFIPHDPYVRALTDHHRWRKLAYWHLFEKPLIEGAAAVQLLDESHEAPLRMRGVTTKTLVIPNGCELSMLDDLPSDTREPGADPDDLRILYFGRMDRHHKGLDILLEGFALALAQEPEMTRNLTLIMTGNDWTDRSALEGLAASLGIAERVRFTGRRPETAMEIVSDADLAVLPSRFDGFGMCIVEAMLAGRPVMVSNAAGVASHVSRSGGGWIAGPDPEGIRRILLQALDEVTAWPAKGRANREYVIKHLTWDQVAARTLHVYQELFGAEPR